MLVLDDEGGARGARRRLHERLEALGVYRARAAAVAAARHRAPLPRARRGSGRRCRSSATVVPSDAAAYLSGCAPAGREYEVLESVALGDRTSMRR